MQNPRIRSSAPSIVDGLIGDRLRMLRRKADMTLHDLAGRTGVSHERLQEYETGASRISAAILVQLAEELKVPVSDFFPPEIDGDEPEQKEESLRCDAMELILGLRGSENLLAAIERLKPLAARSR